VCRPMLSREQKYRAVDQSAGAKFIHPVPPWSARHAVLSHEKMWFVPLATIFICIVDVRVVVARN
jgi:hypothetical protein